MLKANCVTLFDRFSEKCKCPKIIHANWYDVPPDVENHPGRDSSGPFPLLLGKIVEQCYGNCTGGDEESEISYSKRQETLVKIFLKTLNR